MAKSEAKKAVAKRTKTGASRRKVQKRLGKPAVLTPADTATPQKAETWLFEAGRSQLAAGRTLRTSAEADEGAYEEIAALCRANAAGMKKRGVLPNLVAGAGLIAKRLEANDEAPSEAEPPSLAVARTALLVGVLRTSLNRLLHGTRNADARKLFGLNVPMYPVNAKNVLVACQGIIDGAPKEGSTEAAGYLQPEDVAELKAQMKLIRAEQAKAKLARKAGTRETTERDILTAALELFYDKYAAAIGTVLKGDAVARVSALELIPRREEPRKKGETGVGTTPG